MNSSAVSKVLSYVEPDAIILESNAGIAPPDCGLLSTTLWIIVSSFVHVTVVPGDTVLSLGKQNSIAIGLEDPVTIDTVFSCANTSGILLVL